MKTLTTAIFSVTMLNKSLSKRQWGVLVLLFIGASLAQVSTKTPDTEKDALPGSNTAWRSLVEKFLYLALSIESFEPIK